jgi:CBS domain-containing protein
MKEKNFLSRERQDKISVNSRNQLSTAVEILFTGAIAKVKAEAEEKARTYTDTINRIKAEATEAIARVKAQADEKALDYTDTIARIKAEAEEKSRAYTGTAGKGKPSATVEELFSEAVAKQKAKSEAEAAEAIARVKAEAEEKAKAYTDTIARVKAEAEEAIAEQKAKSEAEAAEVIARIQVEAEKKTKTYIDTIARIKAEAEERARAYTNTAGKGKPSATVEALFSEAVAKQKAKSEAEAEETIVEQRVKSEAEAEETIMEQKVKSEAEVEEMIAEQKAKSETEVEEMIAEQKVKSEAEVEEKAMAYTDTTAGVKAEAEEAIAKVKAQVGAIARVKAEAEEAIVKVMAEAKEVIAKVKVEVVEKARAYTDTIAEIEAEEEAVMMDESKDQPIFETIQRAPALREPMAQSPAVLPGEHSRKTSELCTKNIMHKELVWGSPDDSVQQTFAKMQQHDAGYVMVGRNGVLEGIVSRSDLTGTISPYLRPVFAKWRRPLDDATLQIRIKWIMSKPVHVISPQMPLGAIMRNMCRFRVRALPVADQQGKVLGLVTEANIFKAILKSKSTANIPVSDEGHQPQSASRQAPCIKKQQYRVPSRTPSLVGN